jgi:hypothetical protein
LPGEDNCFVPVPGTHEDFQHGSPHHAGEGVMGSATPRPWSVPQPRLGRVPTGGGAGLPCSAAVITPGLTSSTVDRALSTASSARGSGVPWVSGGIAAGCAPMIAGRAACRGGTVRLPRSRAMGVYLRADGGSAPCLETRRFRRLQRPCAPVRLSPPFAPLGVADVLLRWCHLSPGSCASFGVAQLRIHEMSINYM